MLTKAQIAERDEARAKLRALLAPGDTIHTILRHVSSSGMQRCISLVYIGPDGPLYLDSLAARAMGDKLHPKHEGIKVSGCGMDMGFHLVYNLGCVLFPEGFDLPPGKRGRNGDTSGHDSNGGYALTHRWL